MKALKQARGVEVIFGDEVHRGWLPSGSTMPEKTPCRPMKLDFVILDNEGDGFILEWKGEEASAPYSGDTWHTSLEDALEQARENFGIDSSWWESVEP